MHCKKRSTNNWKPSREWLHGGRGGGVALCKVFNLCDRRIATCLHGECGHCGRGSGRGNDRPLTMHSSPPPPPTRFFHSWRPPALLEIGHKPKVPKTFAANNNNNSNNVLNCCHWLNKSHAPLAHAPAQNTRHHSNAS